MSLVINPRTVTAVLLADGWHVVRNRSFTLNAYEFEYSAANDDSLEARFGNDAGGFSAARSGGSGFRFEEGGGYVSGPFTAILAVRHEMYPEMPRRSVPHWQSVQQDYGEEGPTGQHDKDKTISDLGPVRGEWNVG